MAKIHDPFSLVNLYFVAKLLCVAQIQTGLNLRDALQRQNSVNGMLQECTKSHKATCRSYLSPRRVAATCRLVCPDL